MACVMVKAARPATLMVAQSKFWLEILAVSAKHQRIMAVSTGRPSIPPEQSLRAFFPVRSELQSMSGSILIY